MSGPTRRRMVAGLVTVVAVAGFALPATARAPARMLVTAQEWSLTLSRGSVPAGPVTVQLYDRGQDAHNLNVRRLGARRRMAGRTQRVSLTQSGGLTQAGWRLAPGRYELYCSLPGHLKLGMRAFLTVR
jgi:hypothetical protein